jgi:hypothetical protein
MYMDDVCGPGNILFLWSPLLRGCESEHANLICQMRKSEGAPVCRNADTATTSGALANPT